MEFKLPDSFGEDPGLQITDQEFRLFKDLIYKHFGIHLTDAKRSLLVRRLQQWLRQQGFSNFKKFYDHLIKEGCDEAFSELANRITTNYTFFNREPDHFTYFSQTALPQIAAYHKNAMDWDIRVWCAAASTGEEPYMLAMLLMRYFGKDYIKWDAGVLATDISHRALEQARRGCYTEEQVKPLPRGFRNTYFQEITQGLWQVRKELMREVTYRRFNLINRVYPFRKPFDVIFCRNVMIYFDQPTKQHVIKMLLQSLRPGGYLFVGHSESISRDTPGVQYIKPAVYCKVGGI